MLLALEPAIAQWRPVSRFPSSDIDLAFVVARRRPGRRRSARAIAGAAGELLADLELFDVYRGPGIDAGQRSLAFRLRLQAADHTLTDAEVAAGPATRAISRRACDARARCSEADRTVRGSTTPPGESVAGDVVGDAVAHAGQRAALAAQHVAPQGVGGRA